MPFLTRAASTRNACLIAASLACLMVSGCASALNGRLASLTKDKDVEAAAADTSFPSAAEAGLASSSAATKTR